MHGENEWNWGYVPVLLENLLYIRSPVVLAKLTTFQAPLPRLLSQRLHPAARSANVCRTPCVCR